MVKSSVIYLLLGVDDFCGYRIFIPLTRLPRLHDFHFSSVCVKVLRRVLICEGIRVKPKSIGTDSRDKFRRRSR